MDKSDMRQWRVGLLVVSLALVVTGISIGNSHLHPASFSKRDYSPGKPQTGAAYLVLGRKIPINRARTSDLVVLPGIGQKRAEDIVLWRTEKGPFINLSQLRYVPGVGSKTFSRIEPYLTVEDEKID